MELTAVLYLEIVPQIEHLHRFLRDTTLKLQREILAGTERTVV